MSLLSMSKIRRAGTIIKCTLMPVEATSSAVMKVLELLTRSGTLTSTAAMTLSTGIWRLSTTNGSKRSQWLECSTRTVPGSQQQRAGRRVSMNSGSGSRQNNAVPLESSSLRPPTKRREKHWKQVILWEALAGGFVLPVLTSTFLGNFGASRPWSRQITDVG